MANPGIQHKTAWYAGLLALFCLLLYLPLLNNQFLSDDYDSLYRIVVEKQILYRDFLRPMIDVSFGLNYWLGGLHPAGYYLFNILVHLVNGWLVFRFCYRIPFFASSRDANTMALLAMAFFLFYPFHNEGIAWLSGRLASMATLFGLLALLLSVGAGKLRGVRLFAAIACYLLGLLCYESIFLLPLIIILFQWAFSGRPDKRSSLAWLLTMGLYLVLRFLLSGAVYGDYGDRMVSDTRHVSFFSKIPKILGRLLLPPMENSRLMILLFLALAALIFFVVLLIGKKKNKPGRQPWLVLLLALGISLIIPAVFGISTRTSESDRLLYFPSCFLAILLSATILTLLERSGTRLLTAACLMIFFIFFLVENNLRWIRASHTAAQILSLVQGKDPAKIIVNMPDELEGAYIFRNGFTHCLAVNKIDTSSVIVTNFLPRLDYLPLPDTIRPVEEGQQWQIPPSVTIRRDSLGLMLTEKKSGRTFQLPRNAAIWYWNRKNMMRFTGSIP